MNHQWTNKIHDGYCPPYALIPGESIPTSIPTLCNLMFCMFHFVVDTMHQMERWQVLSAGPVLSRAAHQELYVWMNLHLQGSTKSILQPWIFLPSLMQPSPSPWCSYWNNISAQIQSKRHHVRKTSLIHQSNSIAS